MRRSVPSAPKAPSSRRSRTLSSGVRARTLGVSRALDSVVSALEGMPWMRRLDVVESPPAIFRVASDGERLVELPSDSGPALHVHLVWDPADAARAHLVDAVLALARSEADARAAKRDLKRARLDAIDLRVARDAAEAAADVAVKRADSAERLLVERERLTAMSAMCASVAHDIRSPLTALVWNLRVLEERTMERGLGEDPTIQEVFQDTKLACDLIEGVLEGLRTFATGSGAPRIFDARQVITSTIRLFRWHISQRGVRFHQRIDGELAAWGTPSEVCQILLNLLANAADASPRGGAVRLEASATPEGVRIRVLDEGPGIDPRDAEKVFEPFHTTKEGGLGIGLTVARAMARRHGGDLVVAPATRGGACLELQLRSDAP